MPTAADVERVRAFRDRLVRFLNVVLENRGRRPVGLMDDQAVLRIAPEQTWLGQEYGRLYRVINRYGQAMMGSQVLGITSYDVIRDAINRLDAPLYDDLCQLAVQHLDTTIGRLEAEIQESSGRLSADDVYRLTSPVYWLGRLLVLAQWVVGTQRGRIVGAIGAVALVVIGSVVSGAAQAWFERFFAGR